MPFVSAGTHRLYYESSGHGKRPLLLMNGITMSSVAWALLLPQLEAHYQVIRLDFLGQGQSDKPATDAYLLPEQADHAAHLLDVLGWDKVHVAGLSYGGMVAQHFARRHPERVDHLVLASTLAWSDDANNQIAESWIAANQIGGLDLRFAVSLPWLFSSRYLSQHYALLPELKIMAGLADWPSVIRLINGVKLHDARTWLDALAMPTLVVVGDEDRLTPPYQAELLVRGIPGAKLLRLPSTGHALHLEAPDAFARAIEDFCPAD
ncbi:3-oxoadipate enol-lactonase [Crenobacter luteus]|uniref:3-oxoadipate enol-lactonase n=1 Tax=Crenobacter luteus TaxID=1452487 RepID=A0A165G6K3_9NEIS|nr:alpha/beta fold hydrolase [Crenobacter luteus]KZE35255.1 3-oxoadipate enol-lactonase [Crenobacter luteus]TCP13813.1 3-oxoadipate enol-lactonase [Crenobacter luteus]